MTKQIVYNQATEHILTNMTTLLESTMIRMDSLEREVVDLRQQISKLEQMNQNR